MKEWRIRKITPIEEGDRKQGLEAVSAKTPPGNEPFGCWESSKEGGWEQEGSKSDTLCWTSAGGSGGSRLVRGELEAQQSRDCIRHRQRSREEAARIRLSQLDSTGGKEMWFRGLVVNLGISSHEFIRSHIIKSNLILFKWILKIAANMEIGANKVVQGWKRTFWARLWFFLCFKGFSGEAFFPPKNFPSQIFVSLFGCLHLYSLYLPCILLLFFFSISSSHLWGQKVL